MTRDEIMALSGSERFMMACDLTDEYRREFAAAIPKSKTFAEFKRLFYERFYEEPLPKPLFEIWQQNDRDGKNDHTWIFRVWKMAQ